MWFKNLQIYRLPAPWPLELSAFEERLAKHPFVRCGSQDMTSRGFVSPQRNDALVLAANQQWLIALRTEQKLLPSSVVNQVAQDRAEDLEAQQGFKPGRKQMKELKENVTQELLPRAFSRRRTTFAWIDPIGGWLVVDAASSAKAEELIESLRDVLDDLPLRLLDTERSPASAMTEWLASGEAPAQFTIDRDCELRAITDEKAAVRYVRHPLEGDEIPAHLTAGKIPTRLGLSFDDRISFILTERLEIKRLSFLDVVQEEAEKSAVSGDEQFEADFVLMSAELQRFLPALVEILGGERKAV